MAEDVDFNDEFILKVSNMIGSVANNAEQLGMENANFDDLYLGELAHIENGVSFYPIFQGEDGVQIATIEAWTDENNRLIIQFESGIASVLASIPPIANGNAMKLYATSTYAMSSNSLSVPVVGQRTGTNLCWAACISAVGAYRNRPYKSPEQVAASIGKGNVQAQLPEMVSALSAAFQLSSSSIYGGLYINTIMNAIDSGKPIITWTAVPNGVDGKGWGHSVLITGYVYNGNAAGDYVLYMDPNENGGNFMTTVHGNFSYSCYYAGNTPPSITRQAYGYLYLNN